MKDIDRVIFKNNNREEELPGYAEEFPYIASRVDTGRLVEAQAPWHWHREVELFYVERGALEYMTPRGRFLFPTGSGGFVNSNILHMSRQHGPQESVNLIHLFDPVLISGGHASRIGRKYVTPLITAHGVEMVCLSPGDPEHRQTLMALRRSFELQESQAAYELELRSALSSIWCRLLDISARDRAAGAGEQGWSDEKVKQMLAYIQEHYSGKITIGAIAASAYISERECFRVFRTMLNTTPLEYTTGCRLQKACEMLAHGREPVTRIGYLCGLGSSSYFGKTFRARFGCTPTQYRERWQDCDNSGYDSYMI